MKINEMPIENEEVKINTYILLAYLDLTKYMLLNPEKVNQEFRTYILNTLDKYLKLGF